MSHPWMDPEANEAQREWDHAHVRRHLLHADRWNLDQDDGSAAGRRNADARVDVKDVACGLKWHWLNGLRDKALRGKLRPRALGDGQLVGT